MARHPSNRRSPAGRAARGASRLSPLEPYDPAWLVRLARLRMPDDVALHDALARCTLARRESDRYFHFVGEGHSDPASRDWDFVRTVVLENAGFGPTKGDVAVDLLESNRVGGIEFV